MKDEDHPLQGVGMFDANAGADLLSDEQIKSELRLAIDQILRAHGTSNEAYPIEIAVKNGNVRLAGTFPDRGTRRLALLEAAAIPSVNEVDSSDLKPVSSLD